MNDAPRAASIDVQGALGRMGGSRDLLGRLIDEFRDREADVARTAQALAEAGLLQDAIQRVHTAKGTAMILGLKDFSAAAVEIERRLLRDDAAGCAPLWEPLRRELAAAIDACRRERVPAQAAAPVSATTATPAPRLLAPLFHRLAESLDRSSMEAMAAADQVDAALRGTPHAAAAGEIKRLAYGLAFAEARRRVEELGRELALPPA